MICSYSWLYLGIVWLGRVLSKLILWSLFTLQHFGIYGALPESTAVEDNLPPKRQTLCRLSLSYLKKASNTTKYTNPEYSLPLKDAL